MKNNEKRKTYVIMIIKIIIMIRFQSFNWVSEFQGLQRAPFPSSREEKGKKIHKNHYNYLCFVRVFVFLHFFMFFVFCSLKNSQNYKFEI